MTQVGTIELLATIDTSQYQRGAKEIDQTNKSIESSSTKTSENSIAAFSKVAKVGMAGIVTAAVAAGVAILSNIGGAIKRVDTLNNSDRTFKNMGFEINEIRTTTEALKRSILGLPTSMDEAIIGVQLLASSTSDLGKSQKVYSALNNAILGFGGTNENVSNAVSQLSQDLAGGVITAETWNSLLDSRLGPTLNAIAKQMGITSKELKSGLSEGTISAESFTDALIKMNSDGGGGIASLEQIAKDSTSGIATGYENMRNAITRGIAKIITALGPSNISNSISSIGNAFEASLSQVANFVSFVTRNKDVFVPIIVAATTIVGLITAYVTAVKVATLAQAAFNFVMAANPIGIIILAIAALVSGLLYFFTQTETGKRIVSIFFDTIKFAASTTWDTIVRIFTGIGGFFSKVWSSVINIFVGAGTAVGNAVGNAFKAAINGVLWYLEFQVNSIVMVINGALAAIDKITPGTLPRLGKVTIPRLADGGIVMPRPGGMIANIAEAGEAEAVIPLSKLDSILSGERSSNTNNNSNITINISGTFATSKQEQRKVAETIAQRLQEIQNSKAMGGGYA